MNHFRQAIAASMIVLGGATVSATLTAAPAQATTLGCAAGFLGLGAAGAAAPSAVATGGLTTVGVLLGASSATAVIFDQCPMLEEGQVIDIPANATCVSLDTQQRVACPSRAGVYKQGEVA